MVYKITPNQNIKGNLSPAEIMYARKIRSVFDRLLSNRKKNYTKIKKNYTKIKTNYTKIKTNYRKIKTNYTKIKTNYRKIKKNYTKIKTNYTKIKTNYRKIKKNYTKIKTNYTKIKTNYRKIKKNYTKIKTNYKSYKEGDKVFLRNYWAGKCFWEGDGIVTRRIGRVIYIIQGSKFVCNQLRPRYIETVQNNEEIPMEVLHDSFQIKPPMNVVMLIEATTKQKTTDSSKCESTRTERRINSRKRKRTKHLRLNPKRKKY